MPIARARQEGWRMPISARQWFIDHCLGAGAPFISRSIWSSRPSRSSPSAFLTTRSVVRLPAGPSDQIRVVLPAQAQRFGVLARLDDVGDEPVQKLRRADVVDHRVELIGEEGFRPRDQRRQQPSRRVAGGPELLCQLMLGLQALGDRAQSRQVDAVIVTAVFIGNPQLRIFQQGQLGHDVGHCGHAVLHDRPSIELFPVAAIPTTDIVCRPAPALLKLRL